MTLAGAAIARLNLDHLPVFVVLGGGVRAAGNLSFLAAIEEKLVRWCPLNRIVLVRDRAIVGAALLSLEAAGAALEVAVSTRSALARTFARLDEAEQ